jgi:hypothetical protein
MASHASSNDVRFSLVAFPGFRRDKTRTFTQARAAQRYDSGSEPTSANRECSRPMTGELTTTDDGLDQSDDRRYHSGLWWWGHGPAGAIGLVVAGTTVLGRKRARASHTEEERGRRPRW